MADKVKNSEKKSDSPKDSAAEEAKNQKQPLAKAEDAGPREDDKKPEELSKAGSSLAAPEAEGGAERQPAPARRARGKSARQVSAGVAHITATFNNTMVTITDKKGGVIAWSSAGRLGFAGAKKSSAYAATMVAQDAARQAAAYRLQEVEVRVQGPGAGRESAIRALQSAGLTINAIQDVTPIPHNGCRPRKRRRV